MRQCSDLIAEYLRYCENHESTKRVQLWSFVSIVAAALERRTFLNRGYYKLFPNLYIFIIGKSGLIKKSTSTGMAVDLLREIEGINFMSDRMTQSSLVAQMSSAQKEYQDPSGEIMKQSPVFSYASELAVTLGEVHGSIIELLTTFFDCTPSDSNTPWTYKTKTMGTSDIFGPCLNMLGASTKEWLIKCIPDSEQIGGFTSRCIFVVEDNLPEKLVAWPMVGREHTEIRQRLVEDLRHIATLTGEFRPTKETFAAFQAWYEKHMREMAYKNTEARLNGYMARKGDMILKLAMVRSATLGDDLLIHLEHLEWARQHLDILEPDMIRAFTSRDLVKLGQKKGVNLHGAQPLCDAITSAGRLTDEEMAKLIDGNQDLRAQLLNLMEFGVISYQVGADGQPNHFYVPSSGTF